jgi:protoheme ferro-lyase
MKLPMSINEEFKELSGEHVQLIESLNDDPRFI